MKSMRKTALFVLVLFLAAGAAFGQEKAFEVITSFADNYPKTWEECHERLLANGFVQTYASSFNNEYAYKESEPNGITNKYSVNIVTGFIRSPEGISFGLGFWFVARDADTEKLLYVFSDLLRFLSGKYGQPVLSLDTWRKTRDNYSYRYTLKDRLLIANFPYRDPHPGFMFLNPDTYFFTIGVLSKK